MIVTFESAQEETCCIPVPMSAIPILRLFLAHRGQANYINVYECDKISTYRIDVALDNVVYDDTGDEKADEKADNNNANKDTLHYWDHCVEEEAVVT